MSERNLTPRHLGLDARAVSVSRRLVLYGNVEMAITLERNQGGSPLEMVWKRPETEIRGLMQAGGQALRVLGQTQPKSIRQEHTARLEAVLDRIAAADDWTERLHTFYDTLGNDLARVALTKLVKLGCVPHDLVRCVGNFTDQGEATAVAGQRRERQAYRPGLQRLAASFKRLAADCDRYNRLEEHYGGTMFRLDRNVAAFLRDEAASMAEFIRDADPRRHTMFTRANAHLLDMMRDIKTITGAFQDRIVIDFLNGVPGVDMTVDQLQQLRTRYRTRGNAWTSPRYFGRPISRIVMDGHTGPRT